MQTLHTTIHQLHNNDSTLVLITGKPVSVKNRLPDPFMALNCGAIPFELAEPIFFGHIRGAFTGAIASQTGYFERANGGTLFLEEIGDMLIKTQVKFLRALDESAIMPKGWSSVDLPTNRPGRYHIDAYTRVSLTQNNQNITTGQNQRDIVSVEFMLH